LLLDGINQVSISPAKKDIFHFLKIVTLKNLSARFPKVHTQVTRDDCPGSEVSQVEAAEQGSQRPGKAEENR
jgi:hypothetical protein